MLPADIQETIYGELNWQDFLLAHEEQPVNSIRVNTKKISELELSFKGLQPIPWCNAGFYLQTRPSYVVDPFFHAGAYYVQEASSMFLQQAIFSIKGNRHNINVLDACASPGGKSTLLSQLLQPTDTLVSNEVIKTRVAPLQENLTKWGSANCIITNNDTEKFSALPNTFDVVVADVPCSGTGLFRKELDWRNKWNVDLANFCAERQKRIIKSLWPSIKPGGYLVYSTCSFCQQENEDIIDFILENFDSKSIEIVTDLHSGIVTTSSPKKRGIGYRFYPHLIKGEGFYLAVIKKEGEWLENFSAENKASIPAFNDFISQQKFVNVTAKENVYLIPNNTFNLFNKLKHSTNIVQAGILAYEISGKLQTPSGYAVFSNDIMAAFETVPLDLQTSLKYLQGNSIANNSSNKGYCLLQYNGITIGLGKLIGGRINNLFPKPWRIRKQLV
jgi:16S rRNA C967 or C1407 C5-methylase (RsmB/RsmF family)/NOL1/NOP2/fmu family ribosome biogenesis protein